MTKQKPQSALSKALLGVPAQEARPGILNGLFKVVQTEPEKPKQRGLFDRLLRWAMVALWAYTVRRLWPHVSWPFRVLLIIGALIALGTVADIVPTYLAILLAPAALGALYADRKGIGKSTKTTKTVGPDPRRIAEEWPEVAKAAKVPSARAKVESTDATGFTLAVTLDRGHVISELVGRLEQLESALDDLGVHAGTLTVNGDPEHASRAYLRVVTKDPLAQVLPWAGPSAGSICGQPFPLGRFADGGEAALTLLPEPGAGVSLLVAGAKGSGKSGMLQLLVGELAHCRDVMLWGIDPKRVELSPWGECFDRLVLGTDEAVALLRDAMALNLERVKVLEAEGLRTWIPRPESPQLVIVIDELGMLAGDAVKLLRSLVMTGRAQGISLILATQRPSADDLGDGGTGLRSQLDAVISMRVERPEEASLIFGHRMSEGWLPHRLKQRGEFLISSDEHPQPRRARAYRVTDRDIEKWAAEGRQRQLPAHSEEVTTQ